MPIPANHLHVNLVGTLPRGEEFTTGFWVALDGPPPGQIEANGIMSAIAAVLGTDDVGAPWRLLTTNASYTEARGYFYGGSGDPDEAAVIAVVPYDHDGSAGGGGMPLQVSLTLSLMSNLPGSSRRGRMYLPAIGVSLANGQMTQSALDEVTAWWADRFSEINADPDAQGTVAVVSRKLGDSVPLTRVDADSRLDIQRRRANKEQELYFSSAGLS